jgi:glycerol-3-phosphate acyltransferase PlsY
MTRDVIAVVVAYALGCVQTGYYLVRAWTGQDLRRLGSGSTGARNVGRVLGRWGFILTLFVDVGKGALAVVAAGWLGASPAAVAACVVAVAAGHVWPVQLRFSGGRGVAVALGSLAAVDLRLLGALAAVTLLVYVATGRFHAAGLIGFAALPLAAWSLHLAVETLAGVGCLSAVVLFAHRSHIIRGPGFAPRADGESGAWSRG